MEASPRRAAAIRRLGGNTALRLDEPHLAWAVEQGSLAVFALEPRPGGDAPRRYCFTVEAGDGLFGLPRATGGPALIAVALEEVTLRVLTPAAAAPGPQEARTETDALATRWSRCWAGAIDLTHSGDLSLADLPAFNERLHTALAQSLAENRSRARQQLRDREQQASEVAERALEELSSVLQPRPDVLTSGSAMFVAAVAVGRALGLDLQHPPSWQHSAEEGEEIEWIARASHVRVRRVVLHEGWWRQDCGPLLGFTTAGRRPAALLPTRGGRGYRWFDPVTRKLTPVARETAAELDAEAFVFYRPLPAKASSALQLMRFALRGRSRDLSQILLAAVAATVLGMFVPQATALLVDQAIPSADKALVGQIGLGLLAVVFGAAAFRLAQGIALLRLETGADVVTQSAVWDRLLNLQLAFFRRFSTGDLQSRVNAIGEIRNYLGGTTMRTLFGSVVLLLNLGLLIHYSPGLTLVALGVALISATITVVSGAMILRRTRELLELRGAFFGLMVQLINGISKLRVAAAEGRAFARWAREYSRLLRLELEKRRIQDVVLVLNIAVSTLATIALFSGAATLVRGEGTLTTGTYLAFYVAYGTFIGAIVSLSTTVTDVMAIAILRERARPILDAAPEVGESKTDPGRVVGRVELRDVVFRYEADGPLILDGVSLHTRPGEFVALVGPSGSGKSTLFRMMLGFETPQSGNVLYDGQELTGLDVHAVRRQLGVVLQGGRIMAGSLFENIGAGTTISLREAWEAARAAGFAADVEAMPMGMHTVISEGGTNLSGGQRQRMLICRALVHKPAVLLLDEATSALDNKTQEIVSESLSRLRVTRIVIAHRLSTIRDADRIYVIDGGKVVQQGGFAQLASEDGLFLRLMARQMA